MSYINLSLNSSDYFCICSRSQICCAEQLLMFNQNIFEISSVGRSTYTFKYVNCVNVYSRDVNTHASPTKIMTIGDELQDAVYTCNNYIVNARRSYNNF